MGIKYYQKQKILSLKINKWFLGLSASWFQSFFVLPFLRFLVSPLYCQTYISCFLRDRYWYHVQDFQKLVRRIFICFRDPPFPRKEFGGFQNLDISKFHNFIKRKIQTCKIAKFQTFKLSPFQILRIVLISNKTYIPIFQQSWYTHFPQFPNVQILWFTK